MNCKIWEINGLSLELDLQDADVNERCENAFEKFGKAEKCIPKGDKPSERIRAYCRLFRDLFDAIFGEGTSEKIYADIPDNTDRYDEIYFSFLDFVAGQKNEVRKQKTEKYARYKPVNRQQRRAAGKNDKRAL